MISANKLQITRDKRTSAVVVLNSQWAHEIVGGTNHSTRTNPAVAIVMVTTYVADRHGQSRHETHLTPFGVRNSSVFLSPGARGGRTPNFESG